MSSNLYKLFNKVSKYIFEFIVCFYCDVHAINIFFRIKLTGGGIALNETKTKSADKLIVNVKSVSDTNIKELVKKIITEREEKFCIEGKEE